MMRLLLRHMADRSARRGMAEHVDLALVDAHGAIFACMIDADRAADPRGGIRIARQPGRAGGLLSVLPRRSEEHTSELQSLMRISYAVFCLKKKITQDLEYKSKQRALNKDEKIYSRQ